MARQKSKEVVAAEKAIKENFTWTEFEDANTNDIRNMLTTKGIKISHDKLVRTISRLYKEGLNDIEPESVGWTKNVRAAKQPNKVTIKVEGDY